jgi:hypothetical protein
MNPADSRPQRTRRRRVRLAAAAGRGAGAAASLRGWRGRRGLGVVALLAGLLLAGCAGSAGAPGPGGAASTRGPGRPTGDGRPVSITIPAAGADARVVPVGLGPGRTMEVPGVDLAGWYAPGPRPGEAGPAVIVGHVDSRRGPAVFFRLRELRRGDRIEVGQDGGASRTFAVERVERRPKAALPVGRIWNHTRRPVLRLITCGGGFDRATGHYRDNLIVYATMIT